MLFEDSSLPNIIDLQGISQSYDGGASYIIKDLNFLVEDKHDQGQFVVLMGMSGCGKSTVLRYIAGLQQPTAGTINLHGSQIDNSKRVSMVFQRYSSLPWMTVLENVALALRYKGISKKEREEKALEMIELVGLAGHEHKFAQYPTLSGGQLQRIAIARSMIANPDILLMDEPFGALDVNTRLQMQDLLLQLWHKFHPTIVFVTDDISEAIYLGDDVYIMKSAPSRVVEHLKVDLPFERDHSTKRNPRFMELVHELEDKMIKVAGYQ